MAKNIVDFMTINAQNILKNALIMMELMKKNVTPTYLKIIMNINVFIRMENAQNKKNLLVQITKKGKMKIIAKI
jgi:hypothetical protein